MGEGAQPAQRRQNQIDIKPTVSIRGNKLQDDSRISEPSPVLRSQKRVLLLGNGFYLILLHRARFHPERMQRLHKLAILPER
jgi:hypothetical protein